MKKKAALPKLPKGLFLRGGVYWMRLSIDGRLVRKSTQTSNKALAETILAKARVLIAEGRWIDRDTAERYTYAMLIEEYFKVIVPGKAAGTQKRDLGLKKHLDSFFSGLSLAEITLQKLERYKAQRLQDVSPSTVRNEMRLLSSALKHAKRWKWCRENVSEDFNFAQLKPSTITRFLTDAEEIKLMDAAKDELAGILPDVILFAIHTGASGEEIMKAQWSQIDFERKTFSTTRKKTLRPRTIPMNETLTMALQGLSNGAKCISGHIFHVNGMPLDYTDYSNAFRRAVRKSGIVHFRPHDCRHTFASRLVMAGRSLYEVAQLLGHTSLEVSKKYAHLETGNLHHAVACLDKQKTQKLTHRQAINE